MAISGLTNVKRCRKMFPMTTTSEIPYILTVPTMEGEETIVPTVRNLREAAFMNEDFPAVITVGPSANEVRFGHSNHLVQEFGDVAHECSRAPKWHHIEKVTEFGLINDGPLLVHCHAGMSRSTSSAIGVLLARGVDPETAVSALASVHPRNRHFIPNPIVIDILSEMYDYPDLAKIVRKYEFYPKNWL